MKYLIGILLLTSLKAQGQSRPFNPYEGPGSPALNQALETQRQQRAYDYQQQRPPVCQYVFSNAQGRYVEVCK